MNRFGFHTGKCHEIANGDAPGIDDALAKNVLLSDLVDVLTSSFAVKSTADMTMYLSHFATADSSKGPEDASTTIDLEKLLQHLELFDHDADEDDDDADDDDETVEEGEPTA